MAVDLAMRRDTLRPGADPRDDSRGRFRTLVTQQRNAEENYTRVADLGGQ